MAKSQLTCTFYIGGKQVDKRPPEYKENMAKRLGEAMSVYFTQHPDEYKKIKSKA